MQQQAQQMLPFGTFPQPTQPPAIVIRPPAYEEYYYPRQNKQSNNYKGRSKNYYNAQKQRKPNRPNYQKPNPNNNRYGQQNYQRGYQSQNYPLQKYQGQNYQGQQAYGQAYQGQNYGQQNYQSKPGQKYAQKQLQLQYKPREQVKHVNHYYHCTNCKNFHHANTICPGVPPTMVNMQAPPEQMQNFPALTYQNENGADQYNIGQNEQQNFH